MCEARTAEAGRQTPSVALAAYCLSVCFLVLLSQGAVAQGEPPAVTSPAPAGKESGQVASDAGLRILINGYLTQAYAISDGNQIVGIPKQGTADYRTAALQMRVDLTSQDTFSVKLRHERMGQSPFQAFQSDVALDWLFYERRFGASAVRVGRVKIPFGIFNEVRDVGTLLPFYRTPTDFYGTGSFTTATVDGALVSHSFDLGRGWQLDGDAYFGNWEFVASESEGVFKSRARSTLGVELRLGIPHTGLQISAGGMDYEVVKEEALQTVTAPSKSYHVSVEETYRRLLAQVEYKYRHTADAKLVSGYVRLGFRLTDQLTANLQVEHQHTVIQELPQGVEQDLDRALGLSYAFREGLVLKLEHHWNRGLNQEPPSELSGSKRDTRYGILSLAVSF